MAKRRGRHFRYLLLTFHTHYSTINNICYHKGVKSKGESGIFRQPPFISVDPRGAHPSARSLGSRGRESVR
jgi:hypothetical protein